jgi:hypothetical protein
MPCSALNPNSILSTLGRLASRPDGGVDELALAGAQAVVVRGEHPDRGQEAVSGVAQRGQRPQRGSAIVHSAVGPFHSGQGGSGLVVAGLTVTVAAVETAGVAVDHVGIGLRDRVVVQSQAYRCAVAHVVLDDVGLIDEPLHHLQAAGILQVHRQALLASVGGERDVGGMPEAVPQGVHLDHCGTQIREQLGAERTRDRQTEVDNQHAIERRFPGRGRADRLRCGSRQFGRLGPHRVGVLPAARRPCGGCAGAAVQAQHRTYLVQRSQLGVVDHRDAAVGEHVLIGERFGRRLHDLQAHPGHPGCLEPLGGGELGERLAHQRQVVPIDDEVFGAGTQC